MANSSAPKKRKKPKRVSGGKSSTRRLSIYAGPHSGRIHVDLCLTAAEEKALRKLLDSGKK
jgi:hypothetical protein